MAIRGKKPTATVIKLVTGNPGNRALPKEGAEPTPQGPIEKPPLKGKASDLWDRFIARAFWLTWADGPKALIWVHLQAEFERAPAKMQSARIGQLRALGSELGLDPSSRSRLGAALKPGGSANGAEGGGQGQEPKGGPKNYFD
ncbi:MAG: hypothetical protein ACREIB_01235 [Pseudomonadota bacterium]